MTAADSMQDPRSLPQIRGIKISVNFILKETYFEKVLIWKMFYILP